MLLKIMELLNLMIYGVLASQPIFYLLALGKATKNLRPSSYTELRNQINNILEINMRVLYYTVLLTSIGWFICTLFMHSTGLIITSLVAVLALFIDMFFLFSGDIPINNIIKTWTPENYPTDWEVHKKKWFWFFRRRQVAILTGFTSLLLGAVFG
jgi:hypothetical protein